MSMRPPRCLRPLQKTRSPCSSPDSFAQRFLVRAYRVCSCSTPRNLSLTNALETRYGCTERPKKSTSGASVDEQDHRSIGASQSLFTIDTSSPGTPFFLPDGTHIFQKLTSFLRAQYPDYGFREVLTPTIYKETLWRQSGHWANYKDDMFEVTGMQKPGNGNIPVEAIDGRMQPSLKDDEPSELESYGLKPMNCPGHCILFRSKRRSYKDLPIRYAEFSPLHRNEISGALSGLTRVRRFHQDDGHIFCRPSQVMHEVLDSIRFVKMVYRTLHFTTYDLSFVLSTRPNSNYIGTLEEWDMAEAQLKKALDYDKHNERERIPWSIRDGDGAFYGPKIDVILQDSDRKQHQTATIQLDFQLPKRFELEYEAPAPDLEARGLTTHDHRLLKTMGRVAPVMIHRAILGSLERFIALLLEHENGKLPFWLSPRQAIILTVTDSPNVVLPATAAKRKLSNASDCYPTKPRALDQPRYIVDIDDSGDSIARKIVRAKMKKYNLICVMGLKNVRGADNEGDATMDVEVNRGMQPNLIETWGCIDGIRPGSQTSRQLDRGIGGVGAGDGVRLEVNQVQELMRRLCENYL